MFDEALRAGLLSRLRGKLMYDEFKKCTDSCLKCNKSMGPGGHSNESIWTMSEMELNLLKAHILTTDKASFWMMTITEMIGVISLLHKGGETAVRPSDWRPAVLLNSTNQLVMHMSNSRFRILSKQLV